MTPNQAQGVGSTFTREFEGAVKRLRDNISPYTQYVHNEQDRMAREGQTLNELQRGLEEMQTRINKII